MISNGVHHQKYDERAAMVLLLGFDGNDPILQECIDKGALVIVCHHYSLQNIQLIQNHENLSLVILRYVDVISPEYLKSLVALFVYNHLPWVVIAEDAAMQSKSEWFRLGASLVLKKGSSLDPVWSIFQSHRHNDSDYGLLPAKLRRVHRIRGGERIYPETHRFWRIKQGMIFIEMYDQNDNVNIIDVLDSGDIYINTEGLQMQCSLYAAQNVVIHAFDSNASGSEPGFAAQIERQLCWSLRLALARSERDLESRLIMLLTALASRFGHAHGSYQVIEPDLTHAQIASLCGASRASVTRVINKLKRRQIMLDLRRDGIGRGLAILLS
ncbi:MAG: hypothetical protein Tsb0027_25100 [Wenzhouxiangellaceae bacterium]